MNCPSCETELPSSATYCPHCGTKVAALTTGAEIDDYVKGRVRQELERKLMTQNVMVANVADDVEDLIWEKIKRYSLIVSIFSAIILALLGYFGLKTYSETLGKLTTLSGNAIRQVHEERETIFNTASEANELKKRTDALSKDVQSQTDRIVARGGEISRKIIQYDEKESELQATLKGELARTSKLSQQLDEIENSLKTSAAEVSHQVAVVGIEKQFPGLGATRYVTLGGQKWGAINSKKTDEKYFYFDIINSNIIPQLKKDKVIELAKDIKDLGVKLIFQSFGTSGPSSTTLDFPDEHIDVIFYFHSQDKSLAEHLSVLLSKALDRRIIPKYFNPATDSDAARKLILQTTDLDFYCTVYHNR